MFQKIYGRVNYKEIATIASSEESEKERSSKISEFLK